MKIILLIFSTLLAFLISGCVEQKVVSGPTEQSIQEKQIIKTNQSPEELKRQVREAILTALEKGNVSK